MLRRFAALVLACILFAVPAFAAPLPGEYDVIDGNTYLQTFMVADADPEVRDFWIQWKASDRNVMAIDIAGGRISYGFLIIPEGGDFSFTDQGERLALHSTKGFRMAAFERDGEQLLPQGVADVPATGVKYGCQYIVSGTYFGEDYSWPKLSYDYLVDDYEGMLVLVDDLEEEPQPQPPGGGEEEGGWLDGLLDGIKDLFLPSEDYLQNWFDEIRDAASEKFGAIFDLYEILKEAAAAIQQETGEDKTFIWSIGANKMYPGSPAVTVDIFQTAVPYFSKIRGWFTVILVILTAVICYRRIVSIFEF